MGREYEIIVVDDGSTDKTADIIKSFGTTIRGFSENSNNGASAARNKGLLAREKIQVAYIPEILVQMRIGGESNASIQNLIWKMKQDYKAMGNNGISFPMLALFYKNASKISQFFKREGNSNN